VEQTAWADEDRRAHRAKAMGAPMVLGSDGEGKDHSPPECVPSICPYCACGCGLHLLSGSHGLAGVSPTRSHPASRGRLCARGWGAHEADLWGERLLRPSVRGSSGLVRASWEEALGRAAAELQALLAAGKRVGVLVSGRCTNEEAYLGVKLARGALKTGNVDGPLRLQYQGILQGLAGLGDRVDRVESLDWIEGSQRIFVLEGNVAATHPQVAFSVLRGLKKGASLVTLGLARTPMSQVASAHIFLDPGSPSFLHPGPLELRGEPREASHRVSVVLSPWTPDPDALCASVRALARCLGGMARESGQAIRFLPLPVRANSRGSFEMGAAPGHLPGPGPLEDTDVGDRLKALWGMDPAREVGLDVEGMLATVEGLVVVRDGLSMGSSGILPYSRTLPALESLVVLDALRSPASDAASVVLPVGGMSETEGTFTSGLGLVQRLRIARRLPGECRQGWQVLADLLGRLGSSMPYTSLEDVFAEVRAAAPAYGTLNGEALDKGWGGTVPTAGGDWGGWPPWERDALPESLPAGGPLEGTRGRADAGEEDEEELGTHWLAVEGAFDWSEDAMVQASPTLRRDGAALRKLHPRGFVVMSPVDAASLGIRQGWTVSIRSQRGGALAPVSLSSRAEEGFLLVPAGLRGPLASVLGDASVVRVEVERT
jgi:predicted molibdopterin-dependent oxidoreductase YjgC